MGNLLEEKTLYVGFDDSNHAGDRKGDILVASFSFDNSDGMINKFKNRKDSDLLRRWLVENNKDYRFVTLFDKSLRYMQPNLPIVAPYLIGDFLNSYGEKIKEIRCSFDGIIKKWHKEFLMESLSEKFNSVFIDNFVKKDNIHNCPKIVYISHVLAHDLYERTFQEIINHNKRVEIPNEQEILSTFNSYKNEHQRIPR